MSDGIKNTLIVIGFVILVLFISFCSCMTITSFRNKVYDILDVVSEKQANEKFEEYIDQINKLKSVNSIYETCSHLYDFYEISIQNQIFGIDILHNETYYFTQSTNLATKITFDGIEILSNDLSNLTNDVDMYNYNVKYNYSVNADNQITDFTCKITITSN